MALKWPEERTAENDKAVLEIALQMEALVARMQALARAEQARAPVEKEPVALAVLVEGLLEALAETIGKRRLTVERILAVDAVFETDAVLMRSIVTNLLENAVNYSRVGGVIVIAAEMADKAFVFRVSNPTNDLGADDLPKLFERFWRKDNSRTGGTHAGLGLALSRSLAEQLGCALGASLDARGVLTMTLRGPR